MPDRTRRKFLFCSSSVDEPEAAIRGSQGQITAYAKPLSATPEIAAGPTTSGFNGAWRLPVALRGTLRGTNTQKRGPARPDPSVCRGAALQAWVAGMTGDVTPARRWRSR